MRVVNLIVKLLNIADMLTKDNKDEIPIGETLSEEVGVYRIKVVTSFSFQNRLLS